MIFSLASSHRKAMTTENPLVTICLPIYNGEDYVREAIGSALKQTFEDFELLLLDNASTDGTSEICREVVAGSPGAPPPLGREPWVSLEPESGP